jgi:putative NADH-flavin reductase
MNSKAVLIIGASGRTGNHIIQQVSQKDTNKPKIFAFCRDPSKLDSDIIEKCAGIIQGDARKQDDLERAVTESKADLVVVSIGNGDSVKKSDIRTASAQALVNVLSKPNHRNIQALVISSTGAGGSRIIVGFGIGRMIEFHLRHVFKDHSGQEKTFLSSMKDRTLIVRPTALKENESTGKMLLFGDKAKSPTIATDRKDLAEWLVNEAICPEEGAFDRFGTKPVNITCVKK